jgi:hypothetical protein
METSFAEGLVLLVTALLPVAATLLAIYLVVRLAIRHERRNHPDR